jgi:predicted O-methyltransferase YrrM
MIDKIKLAYKFLKYLISAKHSGGHGIHSPFLFDIAMRVIFCSDNKKKYHSIHIYKNSLKKNHQLIDTEDKGAGSILRKSTIRKINEIAINSSTRNKYGRLLARLIAYFRPATILELGTSFGIGTLYLAINKLKDSKLYTIEASGNLLDYAKNIFREHNIENIIPICGNFDEILPDLLKNVKEFDFVFIDGNHKKEPTIRYFEWLMVKKNNNSVFVFDDIHWSDEMEEAWNYIKGHAEVKLSVDLFQFGLVFFKEGLSQEHFIIRY